MIMRAGRTVLGAPVQNIADTYNFSRDWNSKKEQIFDPLALFSEPSKGGSSIYECLGNTNPRVEA